MHDTVIEIDELYGILGPLAVSAGSKGLANMEIITRPADSDPASRH